jgi:hypothetical protein
MDMAILTDELLKEAHGKIMLHHKNLGSDDKVVKETQLVADLKSILVSQFGGRKKSAKPQVAH